jgi:NAD(P)-dependent dehydrogenase (short-subunit alcohol dehydrogenase family)
VRYSLFALILLPLLGQSAEPAAPAALVKAVLVTGASTGIGRNPTEHLAAAGYFFYAGARFTDRTQYKEPDEVSAAIMLALFEEKPKRRYMVTPDQKEAEVTIRKQLEQLAQLNEDQPYGYTRDELVKMLDEALAATRPKK